MLRGALVAFAIVVGMHVAVADEAANKKRAQELASESATHYKRGEFEISVALLRQAYALYPEPNLQYNLGRSLESLGDAKGAIEAYETYLASGKKIEDRGAIERRVATLKAQLEKEAHDKPAKPEPAPAVVSPPAAPPAEAPRRSALPWVPIGVGVAAIASGVYIGHVANQRHDQAVAEPVGLVSQQLQDDAHRYATIANVAFGVGAVALAVGVVWEIRELSHARHASGVGMRARLSPTGVALEWSLP